MGVVAIAVFALLHVTPGDPAVIIAGDYATSDDIARIRARLGLDQPFTTQVGLWPRRGGAGRPGTSIFSGLPVSTLIGQRAATTAWLTLFAMVISVGVGVPAGVGAARRGGRRGGGVAARLVDRPGGDDRRGLRLLDADVLARLHPRVRLRHHRRLA